MAEKPDACDTCSYETRNLTYYPCRSANGIDDETTPYTLRSHWLCRLCEVAGFEVHRGRIEAGLVRMLNVLLEEAVR